MATRERLAQTSNMEYRNMEHKFSIYGHKRTSGSNQQYEVYKYSISGHKRTPGSNEQYEIQILNKWPQEHLAQTSNNEIQIFK